MPETGIAWPPSLRVAATPPGPELPALRGDGNADAAVVGAGFTGLSTARAVAPSVALGRELAAAARGVDPDALALPFSEPRPVPLHGLAKCLAPPSALLAHRRRDARGLA